MLEAIQYRILKYLAPNTKITSDDRSSYEAKPKLLALLGDNFFHSIAGKVVVDFGCGEGDDVIEMAKNGAACVIGVDIREEMLQIGRRKAAIAKVSDKCRFKTHAQSADIVVSLDAFEHFEDAEQILRTMSEILKPGGQVFIGFGPTWYHPMGGHLFSVFPWSHLIFSEKALIRWRSDFANDGATRFSEVAGGLNQMTIKRFETLLAKSPLQLVSLKLMPIRKLRWFHNRFTREFFTAIVQCRMMKPVEACKDFTVNDENQSGNAIYFPSLTQDFLPTPAEGIS